MPSVNIKVEGDRATLTMKNGQQHGCDLNQLQKFYCLLIGSDVLANDSTCYLLHCGQQLWLIPELTPGAAGFRQWFPRIEAEGKAVVAALDYLPFSWKATWRILPGIEAKLRVLHVKELEKVRDAMTLIHDRTLSEAF